MSNHLNTIKIIVYIYIIFLFKHTNQEDTGNEEGPKDDETQKNEEASKDDETSKVEGGPDLCQYDGNLTEYLNGSDSRQRCFDLSNNFGNQACCYDESSKKCYNVIDGTDSDRNCPKTVPIPNNCGLAGIYQPETPEICTQITLVQGYCCYVGVKKADGSDGNIGHSCLRTKKLAKEKEKAPEQIKSYVEKNAPNYTIESCICWNSNLQYFWILNLIINIFLLL